MDSTTFVELESPGIGDSSRGKVLACKTLNVSRGGLLVTLEREVPVGAILQIGVDLPQAGYTLYLAGEVRWCTPAENADVEESGWYAGFQILNAKETDIGRLVELICSMELDKQSSSR